MLKRRMPRQVWMFWEQGVEAAPEIVRECIAAWPRMNPGWEVRVLDGAAARRAAPRFAKLAKRCPLSTPTVRSDLLRLELLARYGGVWADATTLPRRPLDEWLHDWLRPSGFFCFHHSKERIKQTGRLFSSWFLASVPKNPLTVAFFNDFRRVWQCLPEGGGSGEDFTAGYFVVQRIMLFTISTHAAARRVWSDMPIVETSYPPRPDSGTVAQAIRAAMEDRESALRHVEEWGLPVLKCHKSWMPQHVAVLREIGLLPTHLG
ncbi:MAG: glycosyltransferase [Deltaproteobacteria bacterium]|nr:glycosyltransferase [Deltaproteobacteria bacterium]